MSSTTSSRPSEAAPSSTVFSYAQAAKGRTPTTTAPALQQSNQAISGVNTPQKDSISSVNTPSVGSERGAGSVNGTNDVASQSDTQADVSSTQPKLAASSKPVSSPSSPSFGTASTATLSKEDKDDDFVLVGHSSESARERHTQLGNATEKSGEEKEAKRGKKGKKQKNAEKEAEKEKEEVKPEILVPAPLPTVNFWSQRKEVASKAKPTSMSSPQVAPDVPAANEATKSTNFKNRTKIGSTEEAEKGALANGTTKDAGKSQKKGGDVTYKAKEEQSAKRASPRGGRVTETDEKPVVNQLPPPVEDAVSWPTPETASEEEKRKALEKSEKEEKDEANSNKQPRPKEKWVTVPYTPSVTFNTPMPTRGARGRGGARGGRTDASGRPTNVNGEKSSTITSSQVDGRPAGESDVRAAPIPPIPNRQANEQSSARNQRKSATTDKAKNEPVKNDSGAPTDARLHSGVTSEPLSGHSQDHPIRDATKSFKQDHTSGNFNEINSQPRSNRQSESGLRGSEVNLGKEVGQPPRDRAEGRSDRGRGGGFRGRGGHNGFPNGQHPQHAFPNGHPSQVPNGYPIRQSSGPYSPPLQQQPFANQYVPAPTRNGRNSNQSRSQSIPNSGMYRNFGPGGAAGQHMSPLQTSNPMYDYSMQSISAGPYTPYIDSLSIVAMVTMQLEYYFSIDNLCKDVYLRKHMDSQGFVFLSFIAGFKRIQSLTQDFELLKWACSQSDIIEIVKGADGHDRLRRKEGWEQWVLAVEERDEAARHDGPGETFTLNQWIQRTQPMPHMMNSNHHTMSPVFSPNGTDQMYRPYSNGVSVTPSMNGNGASHPEVPLSAAVPEFAPGHSPVNGLGVNGHHDPLESEITFSDEEVAALTLVFASPRCSEEAKPKIPFHNASSRTFSNGSIDGKSVTDEYNDDSRQGRTLTNGARTSET